MAAHPETVKPTSAEVDARWADISEQVEEIRDEVFKVADNIVNVHLKFGFKQFADNVSPTLEDILLSLQIVELILDRVIATDTLDYLESQEVGNAKQQILWIQTISNALRYGNETDYLDSIKKLGNQKH